MSASPGFFLLLGGRDLNFQQLVVHCECQSVTNWRFSMRFITLTGERMAVDIDATEGRLPTLSPRLLMAA